jgi:hypothetical protein
MNDSIVRYHLSVLSPEQSKDSLIYHSGKIREGAEELKIDLQRHRALLKDNFTTVHDKILEVASDAKEQSTVFVRKLYYARTKMLTEMFQIECEGLTGNKEVEILYLEDLFEALKKILPEYMQKMGYPYRKLNFWHLVSPLTWLSNFFRITNIERISR